MALPDIAHIFLGTSLKASVKSWIKSNRYGASPDVRRYGANVAFDIRDVSRMLKDIWQDNDNSKSKLVWLATRQ